MTSLQIQQKKVKNFTLIYGSQHPSAQGVLLFRLLQDKKRGFSADMAQEEASRCLQCGLICYVHSAAADEAQESPEASG